MPVAGFTYLQNIVGVRGDCLGAVAWCMGRGYALQPAIAEPALKSAANQLRLDANDKSTLAKIQGDGGSATSAARIMESPQRQSMPLTSP